MVSFVKNIVILTLAFWTAVVSFYMSLPVPDDIEEPWKVKALIGFFKFTMHVSVIGEYIGFGYRGNITRTIYESISKLGVPKDDPDMKVTDRTIANVDVRMYEPYNKQPTGPCIIYIHGGGWSTLSVNTHDKLTRTLARQLDVVVVSINYRLAPEYPFPIPVEDCYDVTIHLLDNGSAYKIDTKRITIMGDSAGGSIAAAVVLKLKNTNLPQLKNQVLLYPALQAFDFTLPSYIQNARHPLITSAGGMAAVYLVYANKNVDLRWHLMVNNHTSRESKKQYGRLVDYKLLPPVFRKGYQRPSQSTSDPGISALLANNVLHPFFAPLMMSNLEQSPPTYIAVAGYDCLRDEGIIFAKRLEKAKTRVTLKHYPKGFHCDIVSSASGFVKSGIIPLNDLVAYLKTNL